MLHLNKKYISILLIFLIVFNSFGYVIAYFEMQFIFKNMAYEKFSSFLTENQLTILKIPVNEIINNNEFIEFNESEISYYGKMYDICKKEITGNDVIFYCYGDENEDALNDAFASFAQQHTNQNCNNPVTNFIKLIIKEAFSTFYYSNQYLTKFDCNFSHKESNYSNIYLEVITPPPELS